MSLPKTVLLREVGPREGFQTHPDVVSTEDKRKLIEMLAAAGASEIEVTSFVRPDRVPQMADAEELVKSLKPSEGTSYKGLYLNVKGFERAEQSSILSNECWVYASASKTFLKRNYNLTIDDFYASLSGWLEVFKKYKKPLHGLMVSTAFGCNFEGEIAPETVTEIVREVQTRVNDQGGSLKELSLADTMGHGTPDSVRKLTNKVREIVPDVEVSLHLHDTRGTGIANVYAGLLEGVSCFEASVGGLGGCPFAKGAAGNVVTEDIAYMCEEMGVVTGLNLELYREAAKFAESVVGKELPGKYYRAVLP